MQSLVAFVFILKLQSVKDVVIVTKKRVGMQFPLDPCNCRLPLDSLIFLFKEKALSPNSVSE